MIFASINRWKNEVSVVLTLSSVGSLYQCGSLIFPFTNLYLPFLKAMDSEPSCDSLSVKSSSKTSFLTSLSNLKASDWSNPSRFWLFVKWLLVVKILFGFLSYDMSQMTQLIWKLGLFFLKLTNCYEKCCHMDYIWSNYLKVPNDHTYLHNRINIISTYLSKCFEVVYL